MKPPSSCSDHRPTLGNEEVEGQNSVGARSSSADGFIDGQSSFSQSRKWKVRTTYGPTNDGGQGGGGDEEVGISQKGCCRLRRLRANDRERIRMRRLNDALSVLRSILPLAPAAAAAAAERRPTRRKMQEATKLETLRRASNYIALLAQTVRRTRPTTHFNQPTTSMVTNIASTTNVDAAMSDARGVCYHTMR